MLLHFAGRFGHHSRHGRQYAADAALALNWINEGRRFSSAALFYVIKL
jgi:hypothetical protein